jgi:hypothetical protein
LKYAKENGYSWYADFLNAVVVSHAATFGTWTVIAEIYVAISLVFGHPIRFASAESAVRFGHAYQPKNHRRD